MVFEKRREHAEVQRSNEELKTIVDRARKNDQKIIYCSVSSFSKGDQNFIRKVIDVFRKFSEGVLIVTLGRKLNPGDFKDIPENVYIFSWVPQLEVLAKADCSINHGGIHTIHECIFFGVPMLIYSGKRSDQDGCAARMAFHKLGITGDKDLDGPDEIYIKLERILKDRILLDKIESANRKIKFYRDARILEDFVFKALEKSA
jgi:UDP:flavonoid glycosyltransferase YjiC (YdhE family)